MKRITATIIGVFAFSVCIVFPAHAQHINVAEIAQGAVQIEGDQAKRNAPITWEGVVVTKTTNGGAFKFSTAILPQDCVGELNDGVTTVDVVIAGCTTGQVSGGGVLKTGQTTTFATGDDGDQQAGVPVPNPRFTDNGDGTVTDNLTGLTWLKDAGCLGFQPWANALAAANALADGACGLIDGSAAGDWRVPNRNELTSLLDLGTHHPAVPAGHPFMNVASSYWSSTTHAVDSSIAWFVNFVFGEVIPDFKDFNAFVTAVRGGS